jgi:hypothetical protein
MKDRHLPHKTGAAVASLCEAGRVAMDAGGPSPDLAEAGYSIRSRPTSARPQNVSKNGRIGLIRFDWGSGPHAVSAAATVQGRCRVVHSLGFTVAHQEHLAAKRLKVLKITDHSSFLCLLPFDRLRALSKRSASKRRLFAAIPHFVLFALIHSDQAGPRRSPIQPRRSAAQRRNTAKGRLLHHFTLFRHLCSANL